MLSHFRASCITTLLLAASSQAWSQAKPANDPFDYGQTNNKYEISKLNCAQFNDMVRQKDAKTFETVIWLNGLVAGLDQSTIPFNEKNFGGTVVLALYACRDNSDLTLFDAMKKVKAINKKAN